MHKSVNNLIVIQKLLKEKTIEKKQPKIIAVSKTFAMSEIKPLIDFGHKDFGENKIQEAIEKWPQVKEQNKEVKLHMIGKLQTNKVKFLIPLFDYLHSLDNLKLARKISLEEKKKGKKIKMFIQVNIGEERQKNGVRKEFVKEFYNICKNELNLNIVGLMCLPPNDDKTKTYFSEVSGLSKELGFREMSLGMSNDYLDAIDYGSTYMRIGSKIFGQRT